MKKLLALLLTLSFVVILFYGCGSDKSADNGIPDIGISRWNLDTFNPDTNPILLELGEKTGTKIKIITYPADQWQTKQSLLMQSQDPSLNIIVTNHDLGAQWAKDGMLCCIEDMVSGKEDRYPYVSKVIKCKWYYGDLVNGKAYGMCGPYHGYDQGMFIRQDWLDKCDLKMPQNTDELYKTLAAFQQKFGGPSMIGGGNITFMAIAQAFGGCYDLGGGLYMNIDANGKVYPLDICDGSRDALLYVNRLYREKLFNRDMITDNNEACDKYFLTQKSGVFFGSPGQFYEWSMKLQQVDKSSKIVAIPKFTAPGHTFAPWCGNWPRGGEVVAITKWTKDPYKALDIIEYLLSRAGRELVICGVKGTDYNELKDGYYDRIKENWDKEYDVKKTGYSATPFACAFAGGTFLGCIPMDKYPTFEEAYKNIEIWDYIGDKEWPFSMKDGIQRGKEYTEVVPAFGATMTDDLQVINNTLTDLNKVWRVKLVKADSENQLQQFWSEYVKKWHAAGGDKIIAFYQDAVDKYNTMK